MRPYNLPVAYLCWLLLGWFGVHHIYLRRDRQAFVWFWTCGGFFFGWFFEVGRIPDYVRTANAELEKAEATFLRLALVNLLSFRMKRIVGEFMFSSYLGYLATSALSDEVLRDSIWTSSAIGALAVAIGVHTVANIGLEECSFAVCLLGAFAHFPVSFLGTMDTRFSYILWSSLLSTAFATFRGRRMRTKIRSRRSLCSRLAILSVCNIGMVSLFFLAFYFHGDIELADGNRLKARVLVDKYFASPHWQEMEQKARRLWRALLDEGIEMFIREFSIAINPDGEENAYKVLGIRWNSTEEEIRDKYRKLVKMYHPDKFTKSTAEARRQAEAMFVSIQQSYEKVARRRRKLKKFKTKTEM